MENGGYSIKFTEFFSRDVSKRAASSLSTGAEIEFRITTPDQDILEVFTFSRAAGENQVNSGPARDAQVIFTMTPAAADDILGQTHDDVGAMGVHIGKLIVSSDPSRRVTVRLNTGFLTLLGKGYLGVLTAGGGAFASFLASRGIGGMGAIKEALKKMRG